MPNRPFRSVSNRGRGRGILMFAYVATAMMTLTAFAQVGPKPEAEPEKAPPPLALDLQALLTDNLVISGSVSDATFVVEAPAGKRLVMVPVSPLAVEKDTKLDQFTVKLAAGRFLAWYLPEVEGKSIEARTGVEFKGPNDVVVTLNFIPPRLTKECVLTADGRIKWSVPRALLRSRLHNDGNAYTLKADPTRLKAPSQPRISRNNGESALAYQKRRRQTLADYQNARTQYVIRRKAISEVEDDFEEPTPPRLWAVFEATPQLLREFKLSGPAPLPWKVDMERFRELREMAMKPPAKLTPLAKVVTELVADGHPLSDRAAAIAITAGATPRVIPADHALVETIKKLLTDGDRRTRIQIAGGFARHAAEAPAAGPILLAAATDPDPSVTFGALTARVAVAGSEPDAALTAKVTESITRLLPMSEAPPVDDMINLVLKLAAKQPASADALADGIDLSRIHDDGRAAMIFQVLGHATRNNAVATRWLDRQLLGGSNARIRNETMTKIAELAAAPAPPTPKGKTPPPPPTYRLVSADHAIMKIIALEDADVRAMAWGAIQSFRITSAPAPSGDTTAAKPDATAIYAAVTDIALKQDPTPTAALTFMAAQPDRATANTQITRLLTDGVGAVRLGALRSLTALGKDNFAARFAALSVDHRIDIAALWYATNPRTESDATADAVDPLLGLLSLAGDDDKPAAVVTWFAGRIAASDRPTPRDWTVAMASEQAMLNVLGGDDQEQRRAAAAGLAARIGWPTEGMINGIIKLADDVARTETDPAVRGPKLAGDWAAAKATLAGDTLSKSAGTFIVRIVIDSARPAGAGPLDPTPEPKVVELGRIAIAVSPAPDAPGTFTVAVDPEGVKIAAGADPVALTVADGKTLNALAGEKAEADTALAADPITLIPAADGGWSGAATLANKRAVHVHLVRAN